MAKYELQCGINTTAILEICSINQYKYCYVYPIVVLPDLYAYL